MWMQAESPRLRGERAAGPLPAGESRKSDAPWLVVPLVLVAVIAVGLLLISRWSLG